MGLCVGKDAERIGHNLRVSVRIYVYISYNFVTRNVLLLKGYLGNSSRSDLQLCPPLKKNFGGRTFEDVCRGGSICDTMAGNKRHGRLSTGNKKCGPTK